MPAGDIAAERALTAAGITIDDREEPRDTDLARLHRHLFAEQPPAQREPTGELVWLSAPGEARECVEIARRILKEAANGVRFDEMAILLRSPESYLGLLEHALDRAGIPAYFDRGTRRPDPAGRAFLALLSCAAENLSAARFAEYLSLGQVPLDNRQPDEDTWVIPDDDGLGLATPDGGRGRARSRPAAVRTIDTGFAGAMAMGATARGVVGDRRRGPMAAAARWPGGGDAHADSRPRSRRSRRSAHRRARQSAGHAAAVAGVRAADRPRDGRLAAARLVGRVVEPARAVRTPRPQTTRTCAPRPGRAPADERHRSCRHRRNPSCPFESAHVALRPAATAALRQGVRRVGG